MKILIIPDIHHRTFWKDCVTRIDEFDKVVFLGDYLDPYAFEGGDIMDMDKGFRNFEEIVDLKRNNMEKVVLLYGNHDLHYVYSSINSGRYDYRNEDRNCKFFRSNRDMFDIAWEFTEGGKRYFFSHAGVNKEWMDGFPDYMLTEKDVLPSADWFNERLYEDRFDQSDTEMRDQCLWFIERLGTVSFLRGGYDSYGSMIWSDVREHFMKKNKEFENVYQIFSHTYMKSPVVTKDFACLDVQRGFILEEGIIKEMDGTVVEVKSLD